MFTNCPKQKSKQIPSCCCRFRSGRYVCRSYTCAFGLKPIILERGKDVEARKADVQKFWREKKLNEESNVQFGEGGAGTFSDGKLTTGIKSPFIKKILEELYEAGAPEEFYIHQNRISERTGLKL